MQRSTSLVTPVILSGGSGTRLWPLSRTDRPKQFLQFTQGGTMLELTLARVQDKSRFSAPLIVGNASHIALLEAQSAGTDPLLILEPAARNTAPAIALAALMAQPDALLLVMPSDHLITDEAAFHRAIEVAIPHAADGWLITFGIKPTGPETGYGYIRQGPTLAEGISEVERFVEKPSADVAQNYINEGCYAWNAGIFLFRADVYLAALAEFAPEMLLAARGAIEGADRHGNRVAPDAVAFEASPSDSIDYAVMEKGEKVAVVPVDMGWSDIGSWDALYDLLDKSDEGNVHIGDVVALDSGGCLVRSEGPTVTMAGVDNLIIIATGDSVMILPRGESQATKKIVEALKGR